MVSDNHNSDEMKIEKLTMISGVEMVKMLSPRE
jgi:hypothetical protein